MKNKRLSRGLFAFFFLFFTLFSSIPQTVAATDNSSWQLVSFTPVENHDGVITTINSYQTIEMWHYSGGYWGGNIIRIDDNTAFKDADDLAAALNQTVTFEAQIPAEVKAEIAKGNKVIISCDTSNPNIDVGNLFYMNANGKTEPTFNISGDTLYFKGYPKLNFVRDANYKDYVSGLNKYIPLVDPIYGKNRYSIFTKSGAHLGAADGFIDSSDLTKLGPEGTIHPSQIIDSSGHLKSGFKVNVDRENGSFDWFDSGNLSIGQGTFQNAGAVGMRFWYPMKITFYRVNQEKNDVEVTSISPTKFQAKQGSVANVTVKNNGAKEITTSLNFFISGIIDKTETVTLAAGQSIAVSFGFTAPDGGTITMTAEANKERAFAETDYTNNKKSVQAIIESPYIPPPSTGCSEIITWNESASHTVTYSCSNHGSHSYTCTHTFTYETKLSTTHKVDPKTFKSGYGFAVNVDCSISTRMVSNSGCGSWGNGRSPSKTPTPPTKVEVRLPWKVTNKIGTQSYTIFLNKIESTATTSKFEPAPNHISEIRAKRIYTPVELAGTKPSPKMHSFDIYVSGGGVNGVEFCKNIKESLIINGNMYEDDVSTGGK